MTLQSIKPVVGSPDPARQAHAPKRRGADAVKSTCDWLVQSAVDDDWQERFHILAAYPRALFDYAAEDAFLGAWP